MAGIKALRKIQMGREVTAGTAVAATTIWRGLGTIEDQREVVFPDEDIGLLVPTDRSYVAKLDAALAFDSVPATFEQLIHILEAGVKLVGTGVADGIGSGKIYDYPFAESSLNTIKTYTLEGGDNQEAEEVEYSFVEDFALEGKAGEAWMASATWRGRQATVSTFTGALTIPVVEDMLFSKTKLYIDPVSGNYGTTQKSNTLIGASLKVKTGWIASPPGDGNLYFMFNKATKPEIILEVTFEHDGSAAAEKVNWRAQTPRLIQLKTEGSALTTPGTAYSFKTMLINLAGKWSKFSKIGELDGNDIVTGTFKAGYNATKADVGNILVVNELASVP